MNEKQLRAWAHTTPLEARFWSKVKIIDDDDSCWEFDGAHHPDGYGQFQWTPPGETKRRAVNASRVALYLATGKMPTIACHNCDNPPCCRPSHLYDGTHKTNGADKAARGRAPGKSNQRGEANDSATLTDAIVTEARRLGHQGVQQTAIAQQLGIERATLSYAITGKTWSHLNEVAPPVAPNRGGSKLTDDDVRTIRAEVAAGVPQKDLAARFNTSRATISNIVKRKVRGNVS
jgi:hypothetical protein